PVVENLNFVISGDNITLSIDENLPEYIAEIGNIYPNPVVTEAHLLYHMNEPKIVQVTLVNLMGQVIFNYTEKSIQGLNTLNINTQNMEYGMYYVYLNFNNSYTTVRKFVKTK
ncbi:MAG: T9SS type A sorting domain-containing protein, partial [Bacteroidales bacterium]|nr:T9SS type A sorting domain-containing protein [Bacteroidales bacterium]